jgi:SAM-dependent methyltransferase
VLEVGSRDVCGQNPRQFFTDATEYIGIDAEAGENVDEVMNASAILTEYEHEPFDTIICCEMLEHDIDFDSTVLKMHLILKPHGHLIITTPTFGFPLHRFPKDYWRFGEDAFREVFFAGFDIIQLLHLDDKAGKDLTIAGIGRKR